MTEMVKYSDDDVALIKAVLCPDLTDNELALFMKICVSCGLNPMLKQIYAIKRGGRMTPQTSIDGFRLIAERTGCYSPGREPTFVYDDKNNIVSATAYVKKKTSDGTWHEVAATAIFKEYAAQNLWVKMPHAMISKCAESLALRRAFPAEMSGIYTSEEMEQSLDVTPPMTPAQVEEIVNLIGADQDLMKNVLLLAKKERVEDIPSSDFESLRKKLQLTKEYREKNGK